MNNVNVLVSEANSTGSVRECIRMNNVKLQRYLIHFNVRRNFREDMIQWMHYKEIKIPKKNGKKPSKIDSRKIVVAMCDSGTNVGKFFREHIERVALKTFNFIMSLFLGFFGFFYNFFVGLFTKGESSFKR